MGQAADFFVSYTAADRAWAESMSCLVLTLHDLGDLQGALEVHQQALAVHRRVLGVDHPKTLNSMNNLAAVRRELER